MSLSFLLFLLALFGLGSGTYLVRKGDATSRALGAMLLALGTEWTYYWSTAYLESLWADVALGAAAAVQVVLFLYLVRRKGEGGEAGRGLTWPRPLLSRALLFPALLLALFLAVTLEMGLLFGYNLSASPTPLFFASTLLSAPLLVLGQEGLFHAYALRNFSEFHGLPHGLALTSVLLGVASLNPFVLGTLGPTLLVQYLFQGFFLNAVLAFVAGTYLCKDRWNLAGVFTFRTGLLWTLGLLPLATRFPDWEAGFVAELVALLLVLLVVAMGLPDPRYRRHHYGEEGTPSRRGWISARARLRREGRNAAVLALVVGGLVGLVVLAGGPEVGPPVHVFAIATGSMTPEYPRGTLVFIEPVASPSAIHVGEVIAYNAPYLSTLGPVVHRVISIHVGANGTITYTTKGDANPAPDPRPVSFDQVVGRLAWSLPYLGLLALSPPFAASVMLLLLIAGMYSLSPRTPRTTRKRPHLPYLPGSDA